MCHIRIFEGSNFVFSARISNSDRDNLLCLQDGVSKSVKKNHGERDSRSVFSFLLHKINIPFSHIDIRAKVKECGEMVDRSNDMDISL